jgi:hypothetical protein
LYAFMLSGFAPATACSATSAAAAWSMGRHRTGNLRERPVLSVT